MLALLFESAARALVLALLVWLGLKLFRVRNPHVELTAWTVVLVAAMAMPALMRASPLTVEAPQVAEAVWAPAPVSNAVATTSGESFSEIQPVSDMAAPVSGRAPVEWPAVLFGIYLIVAGVLAARLIFACVQIWLLLRRSRPVRLDGDIAARICDGVAMPATVGATILLPRDFLNWTADKRTAVLLHERSHVARGDFYVQILASMHRAIFWFNPLAWWLQKRLAELAEITSDEAALEKFNNRTTYAEILLDVSQAAQTPPAAVAMARPATLFRRIERILTESQIAARLNRRKHALIAGCVAPIIGLVTVAVAAPSREQALEFLPRTLAAVSDVVIAPPAVPLRVAMSNDLKAPHVVVKPEPALEVQVAEAVAVEEPKLTSAAAASPPHAAGDAPAKPPAATESAQSECVRNFRKVDLLLIIDPRTALISPDGESFKRVTVVNDPNDKTDMTKIKTPTDLCVGEKIEPLGLERGVSFIAAIENINEAEAIGMRDARNARVLSDNRLNQDITRSTSKLCKDARLTPLQIGLCMQAMEGTQAEEARDDLKRLVRETVKRRQAYASRQQGTGNLDYANRGFYNYASGNAPGSNNLPGAGIGDAMGRAAQGH